MPTYGKLNLSSHTAKPMTSIWASRICLMGADPCPCEASRVAGSLPTQSVSYRFKSLSMQIVLSP
jgi:hypothetical protein